MVLVFGDDGIVTRRSRKALLACGNGRFADQMFSLKEVSLLLRQMDHDARLALGAFVVPPTRRRGWHHRRERVSHLLRDLLAAGKKNRDRSHERELNQPAGFHKAADINAHFVRRCNAKHFTFGGSSSPNASPARTSML